jgi:hypothetical protein
LELATNKASVAIAGLDLHHLRLKMEHALAEHAQIMRELDGVDGARDPRGRPLFPGLRARHEAKVAEARRSGPRGEPSVAPNMTADHAKKERRAINLEGYIAACRARIEVLSEGAAIEQAGREAAEEEAAIRAAFEQHEAEERERRFQAFRARIIEAKYGPASQ